MAHYAKLDENNIVVRVNVVGDENDSEEWCAQEWGGTWKKTSYNTEHGIHRNGGTPFRMNYAGIGYTYDAEKDAFIPPKPYPSWLLNEVICDWYAPVDYPNDGKVYGWNESIQNWVEISQ